ncbi:hypothetical protein F0562_003130 [Nyssa sinensis]|uniref:Uncharacterized protein n=1 Tax=Nyssa sinensis TaxID=561372 RepID=A0A5J5BUH0_9ASTE|nr:hypothetical protein F0562_003130 [Nyssa sinensis]
MVSLTRVTQLSLDFRCLFFFIFVSSLRFLRRNGSKRERRNQGCERRFRPQRTGEDPDAEETERDMPRRQRTSGEGSDDR